MKIIWEFFRGPLLLAVMIALPLAEVYMVWITISDLVNGNDEFWFDLFFGWLIAAVVAFILAIPLAFLFVGINAMWQATRWWWGKLPFTIVRKPPEET